MSTISATSASSSSQGKNPVELAAIAKDLQALSDALKKNDTKAAQAAMLKLQQDSAAAAAGSASSSSSSSTSGSSSSSSSSGGSQAASDLASVASALKAGNLSAAQSVFATFESHAAAFKKAKEAAAGDASSATDISTSASDATSSDDGLSDGSTFSVTV